MVMSLHVFIAKHTPFSSEVLTSCSVLVEGFHFCWLVKVQSCRKLQRCLFTKYTDTHTHQNKYYLCKKQTQTMLEQLISLCVVFFYWILNWPFSSIWTTISYKEVAATKMEYLNNFTNQLQECNLNSCDFAAWLKQLILRLPKVKICQMLAPFVLK